MGDYNIGGYELGLSPDASNARGEPAAYWGVDDADAALERLLALDASPHGDGEGIGERICVAAVEDPFGDVVGIIETPPFELSDAA